MWVAEGLAPFLFREGFLLNPSKQSKLFWKSGPELEPWTPPIEDDRLSALMQDTGHAREGGISDRVAEADGL